MLLQNAVHPIMKLQQVSLQAAQFIMQTGKDLSYNKYSLLLVSAAQHYDLQIVGKAGNASKPWIYEDDLFSDHDPDPSMTQETITFDLIQVHAVNFGNGPHFSYGQWNAFPDDAKKSWKYTQARC